MHVQSFEQENVQVAKTSLIAKHRATARTIVALQIRRGDGAPAPDTQGLANAVCVTCRFEAVGRKRIEQGLETGSALDSAVGPVARSTLPRTPNNNAFQHRTMPAAWCEHRPDRGDLGRPTTGSHLIVFVRTFDLCSGSRCHPERSPLERATACHPPFRS